MTQLVRDSIFGQFLHLVSDGKVLQYREQKDPSLWQTRVLGEKSSGRPLARDTKEVGGNLNVERAVARNNDDGNTHSSSSTVVPDDDDALPEASTRRASAEKGVDPNLVDWYGPDDPENPRNWSPMTKFIVTFELCLLTFSVYIGSAIYTAGTLDIMETFDTSQVVATLGLTLFVLGYGLGPMILAPLSEIPPIGRNPVYVFTLALFVVLQAPTALATNLAMLFIFRFITGFLGSPALATGGASIGDMYSPQKRALAIGIWGIAAVCGPVMGPLLGGFAAQAKGWRWTIWTLMWLSAFTLAILIFFLPETSSKNILYRRARRLRKLTGNDKLKTQAEIAFQHVTAGKIAKMTMIRPFTLTFQEPVLFLLNLYLALVYGLLFIWFESFPLVFGGVYGFNRGMQGLAFLGIFAGAFVAIPPFLWYIHAVQEKQFNAKGEITPEKRLPPAMVGAFFVPICLLWFGWSARPSIHWIMPIIGTSFFSAGSLLLFNSVLNYLPDAYPNDTASVLAGNAFMRFCFGAGFPLFAPAMYHTLGIQWASTLLALLGCVFVPIPFAFYYYGEKLRKVSKYARKGL